MVNVLVWLLSSYQLHLVHP